MKNIKNIAIVTFLFVLICTFTACGSSDESYSYASDKAMVSGNMKAEGISYSSSTTSNSISPAYGNEIDGNEISRGNDDVSVDTSIERKLIKNGSMTLQTKKFDEFVAYVNQEITKVGGYLEESRINNYEYSNRYISIVARIPQEHFEAFMDNMSSTSLATVQNKNLSQQDITESYIDVLSHVTTLEIEQERLLEILKSADNIEYIIRIEDKLADIRQDLAYYDSIIRNYDSLVSYSTVNIYIDEVEVITVEPDTLGSRIANEFEADVQHIKDNTENFIVWLLGNIISIIIWVAIICGCVIIIMKYNKCRKANRAEILKKQREANKTMNTENDAE